jgi:hypothetical protein
MIFKMCNQFQVIRTTANVSEPENVLGTYDSSYTDDDSVHLKYDGIFDFRIKLYM